MAKEGTLNSETFKRKFFSNGSKLIQRLVDQLKLGDEKICGLKKENHKSIGAAIEITPTTDGNGSTPAEIKIIGMFKRKYNTLVKTYEGVPTIENPEDFALKTILAEIKEIKDQGDLTDTPHPMFD